MSTTAISKKVMKEREVKRLQIKAALFDELIEFLEDKSLGYLMSIVEKERNVPLLKAKKMMRA